MSLDQYESILNFWNPFFKQYDYENLSQDIAVV